MTELIRDAIEMIHDRPEECKVVHWALSLDDEARGAFMLAWQIVHGVKDDPSS